MLGKINNKNVAATPKIAAARTCQVKLNSQNQKDEFIKTSKKEVSFTSRNNAAPNSCEQLILDKVKGTKYESKSSVILEQIEAYKNTPWFEDVSDDDFIGIFEKVEFNGNAIYQIGTYSFINKALALSWLIDKQIIQKPDLDEIANFTHVQEKGFVSALYSDRFKRILSRARENARNYEGDDPEIKLFAKGLGIKNIRRYSKVLDYNKVLKNIDDDYTLAFLPIQNSNLAELKAWKSKYNKDEGSVTTIIKTFLPNGEMTLSRSEREAPEVTIDSVGNYRINDIHSHIECKNPDIEPEIGTYLDKNWTINGELSSVEVDSPSYSAEKTSKKIIYTTYTNSNNIDTQIEILSDYEPFAVIYTKKSDILQGAYDTTLYELKDYPEDYDVIQCIKEVTIQLGTKLASAYNDK
ncbi:hypothetical protein IJ531_01245, partial [bacterium]|nr:hypothetical protein [bacterium]